GQFGFSLSNIRPVRDICKSEYRLTADSDALDRAAVMHNELSPQRFVPVNKRIESLRNVIAVERAGNLETQWDVVGGSPGLQLFHEPQTLLRWRQRNVGLPRYSRQILERPLRMSLDGAGQFRDGGMIKKSADGQF